MKISEQLRETVLKSALALLLGAIGFVVTKLFDEVSRPFADKILPSLSSKTLCLLILLMLLLIILLGWYALSLHLENKNAVWKKYDFNFTTGIATHKKSGMRVCSRCLLTNVEVPLVRYNMTRLRCINSACNTEFNPQTNQQTAG